MIDFHCHLDLYKNPVSLLPEVKDRCRFVLVVTTSPRAFLKTSQVFGGIECISVGLGLHPEILAEKISERALFLSTIPQTQYIGEIGIDGTSRNISSLDLQADFFRDAIQASEEVGGRVLSIHSRSAVKSVLDIIEQNVRISIPVLHWFTGNERELDRAVSLNCWFSINSMMLMNQKGISSIQRIPIDKLIPETDGPFTSHDNIPYMPWDTQIVIEGIAKQKKLTVANVTNAMNDNTEILRKSR